MIRRELRNSYTQWREVILVFAALALGVWFFVTSFGAMRLVGGLMAIGALMLIIPAIRMARLPRGADLAEGVVEVTERRIRFLGPYGGAEISINDLRSIKIRAGDGAARVWQFIDLYGNFLSIPSDAEGAEALPTALAALPDLNYDAIQRAMTAGDGQLWDIWERS